ncbi:transglycosylase domain-containing protein [Patescibacteria group bacterium]|nr:transglycosylase domain-containing protein [Patescibacteria group bacterium]
MAKRHYKKTYQKNSSLALRIGKVLFFSLLLLLLLGGGVFLYYAKDLPRPENLSEVSFARPTKIYDRTGKVLLYEIHGDEKREFVPLNDISPFLSVAVIAAEDQNFYSHFGVDMKAVVRAVLRNLSLLKPAQGASTITQQLARSTLLSREKTLGRKVRELILTLELERRYSKHEIMEFYLNQIPWGGNSYGVGAAAQAYFEKPASDLTLEESAVLAAMIKAPTYYSPFGPHQDELLLRKDFVLSRMAELDLVSKEELLKARSKEVAFAESRASIKAPHFVLSVLDSLLSRYGEEFLRENGLRVITTLDWELQKTAEDAVDAYTARNEFFNAYNAALVAINPSTGEILSLVGSKNWSGEPYPKGCAPGKNCLFDPKVNVAMYLQGRQPGSAFKPFVYAVAFEKGADDETVVEDVETNFGVWGNEEYIPQNYDGLFRGTVTLRQALAQSLNVPSVKVLLGLAGLEDAIARAKELGITTLKDPSNYGPSLVLGGGEVYLLDMVVAYSVFASEGKRVYPLSILWVEDSRGRELLRNENGAFQIMEPEVARLITNILSDNETRAPVFGSKSWLLVPGFETAVKTGTTQEYRDAWTIGYTSALVAGVWVGNNDNTAMREAPGVVVASPIWNQFMKEALPLITTGFNK